MEKFTFTITKDEEGIPLKKIIRNKYHFSSRLMTKIKYQDLLMLNDKTVPGYIIPKEGDIVTVSIPDERSNFEPQDIPLNIIFEDDDLLVINKSPGITCHPTKGHPGGTYANGIMNYMLSNDQNYKIRFINRLDMDTSGVLLIGKNGFVQTEIIKQMSSDITEKKYIAVVDGEITISAIKNIEGVEILSESPLSFLIDLPIGPPDEGSKKRRILPKDSDQGYPSKTEVEIINTSGKYSVLLIKLHTGRTHQIRVHMAHLGFPILGDILYGTESDLISRQALHAYSFSCYHPITKEHHVFTADTPEDLREFLPF